MMSDPTAEELARKLCEEKGGLDPNARIRLRLNSGQWDEWFPQWRLFLYDARRIIADG